MQAGRAPEAAPVVVAPGVGHHRADGVARVLAALSPGSALGGLPNGTVDRRTAPAYGCRCRPACWASRCSPQG
ncbi:hypothetical protein ACFYW9_02220 [Streptomyces sp. NPDC002698]|uniref:hypothetical protein n=1 Tax=Streptomyces sp. NPDC002698 TaxID=3364660 RepID=UPI00368B11EC